MGSLVSVIIPCYNQGNYIHEAIQSVLASAYPNLEIIVVNDGSTDALTNSIITNLTHPRIKVVSTINQGLAEARNTGIRNSSGEYVLALDADDKISPGYIAEAVEILQNDLTIKVVTCEVRLFGARNKKMELAEPTLENLICKNTLICTSLFRRKDFNLTNGFNPGMKFGFEDWDFWLSILETGGLAYRIPKEHFFYRIKKVSMSRDLGKDEKRQQEMRHQIYLNHKHLYSTLFFNPIKSFEYELIKNSREYKLGKIILTPVRFLLSLF